MNTYYETDNGKLFCMDNVKYLKTVNDGAFDLTVTSPPYDNLRDYKGYSWDFEALAKELYRTTKEGGVVVWIVGDATINGSETGSSFKQALCFMECGFNLHDTMIYATNKPPQNSDRYEPEFEYMFVLSKDKPKTFNPIKRKRKWDDKRREKAYHRQKNGNMEIRQKINVNECTAGNIWYYDTGGGLTTKDKIAFEHPAIFPEQLAYDHIVSWSNKSDLIFDPFMGSGTTAKMCEKSNRKWRGCEISKEYCKITEERVENERTQLKLSFT